jgi:pimeloyl-ACP methyl ester carboxylesterase
MIRRSRRTLPFAVASLFLALAVTLPAVVLAAPNDGVKAPIRAMYVRPPRGVLKGKPVQVLVALHGMGGNGADFSRDLTEQADRYGWMIVAPTVDYGDWRDPNQVAREEPVIIQGLIEYVDSLPERTGLATRKQVVILGHSRGAQLAHRFAEFRPERVLAVAALSAGTYTLPLKTSAQGARLAFPFGVTDLDKYPGGRAFNPKMFSDVQFWVAVGGEDTNPNEVPRQWDAQGTTRVQRAQAFAAAMRQMGASAVLRVFQGVRHELTPEMRGAACTFLAGLTSTRSMVSVGVLHRYPVML